MKVLEVGLHSLGREFYGLGHLGHGLEGRGKLQVVMLLDAAVTSLMASSLPVYSLHCIRAILKNVNPSILFPCLKILKTLTLHLK